MNNSLEMHAAEQTGLDISPRGGAATEVAAGILPAVEPGLQPGGGNAQHATNHCEFKCQIVATNSVKHVSFRLGRRKKFGRNKLFADPNRLLERSSNW